jgi:S-adenosylmethionine-dependent methyltransferase
MEAGPNAGPNVEPPVEPKAAPETGPNAAPRTAVVWAVLRRELARAGRPLTAVDVGGGTGGFAVPLAQAGHTVTVVDSSPDALAALTRRAADAGVADRVTAVQGDGDNLAALVPHATVDLVLCHSLLEVVDDPGKVIAALAVALRPGGAASVVVASRVAAVLAKAIGGQLAAASVLVASPDGRGDFRDRLRRRYDAESATELLSAAGLLVEQIHGVRVVTDLVPGAVAESEPEALQAFELAIAGRSPYRDIATQLHLLARKPEDECRP